MGELRLQKFLAAAGIGSRRKCEELILEGAVEVNRRVVDRLPVFIDPQKDIISVNGRKIRPERKVYFLLNKPKGIICTNSDPTGRKRAIDLINCRERIFCVGRLDTETSGLIILTNDSELTNRLTHPRYEMPKTYVGAIGGNVSGEQIEKLKKSFRYSEGKNERAGLKILSRHHKESLVEITIRQRLSVHIRVMFDRIGLDLKSLRRVKIGRIDGKGLGVGRYRELSQKEIGYLYNATELGGE